MNRIIGYPDGHKSNHKHDITGSSELGFRCRRHEAFSPALNREFVDCPVTRVPTAGFVTLISDKSINHSIKQMATDCDHFHPHDSRIYVKFSYREQMHVTSNCHVQSCHTSLAGQICLANNLVNNNGIS